MTANEIRKKFIEFYKESGHAEIPSAPLVPENDPTTLFTSSGMQPLVPYLLGEPHPLGNRLVNSQKCFRAQDIEEVGDNRHTTFFEMLGNWSLGDYFKKEQHPWFLEFLTKELSLPIEKLAVTIFEGNNEIPKDEESEKIWLSLGIPSERIFSYGVDKNWWSRSGSPNSMPPGEPGGPDSEVFFEFTQVNHNKKFGDRCHPNCNCGRFLEIGNSVFMEYKKQTDGSFIKLPRQNVDFGGGLERLEAATENNTDLFTTDFFLESVKSLEANKKSGEEYKSNPKPYRIIVDHLRAAIFMVADGVESSNKERGYILRRLIRRTMVYSRKLGLKSDEWLSNTFALLAQPYIHQYSDLYEALPRINQQITGEVDKFRKTLEKGLNVIRKMPKLNGKLAFFMYEAFGFPWELTEEIALERGQQIERQQFEEEFKKHQELSRTASKGMFKGGLQDRSEQVIKLHTATHLVHQALRTILGNHVAQKGSNITAERLRFDFSHPTKLTEQQIKNVEDLVNTKIKEDLAVTFKLVSYNKAQEEGALAFFGERYPQKVKVYSIGQFSKEICGGPHVDRTSVLGIFKITKQQALGAGTRRLYAIVN